MLGPEREENASYCLFMLQVPSLCVWERRVESDHKPLQSIFAKPLLAASMRLQSTLLKLQTYDLDVKYKPGKEIPVGDALSRTNLPDATEDMEPLLINMIDYVSISRSRYQQL